MERSNKYIFIYSTILVVIVAAVLAFTANTLKPIQAKNIEIEKKQNILQSVGIASTPADAEALYAQYVKSEIVVDANGNEVAGVSAFGMDLAKAYSEPDASKRQLPLYKVEKDGKILVVIPLRGNGLWDAIWGYISLEEDKTSAHPYSKVAGAIFDHKGETAGLGAEITKPWFQEQFVGKTIYEGDTFTSVSVVKGGAKGDIHGVDAISAGTLTSKGVEKMIYDCVSFYNAYLNK